MSLGPMASVNRSTQARLTTGTFTDHTSGLMIPGRTSRAIRFEYTPMPSMPVIGRTWTQCTSVPSWTHSTSTGRPKTAAIRRVSRATRSMSDGSVRGSAGCSVRSPHR